MQYGENQIKQNAANAQKVATQGASSGGDILDAANKINYGSNVASQQLALQAASYKSSALGGYESALGNEAGWQDKLYQNNQLQPYLRAANTAASLEGAGNINEANAIDSGLQSAQTVYQNQQNAQYKKQLLGVNGTSVAPQSGNTLTPYTDSPINTNQLLGISQYSLNGTT